MHNVLASPTVDQLALSSAQPTVPAWPHLAGVAFDTPTMTRLARDLGPFRWPLGCLGRQCARLSWRGHYVTKKAERRPVEAIVSDERPDRTGILAITQLAVYEHMLCLLCGGVGVAMEAEVGRRLGN